jgi:hypothetical protein
MKKSHDQLLRNIHKLVYHANDVSKSELVDQINDEVFKSLALAARFYSADRFTKITDVLDVAYNEAQTTIHDLKRMIEFTMHILGLRNYKRHGMPEATHKFLVNQTDLLYDSLKYKYFLVAEELLQETMSHLDEARETQEALITEYENTHLQAYREQSHFNPDMSWIHFADADTNPVTLAARDKYHEFRKATRFHTYWKYTSLFRQMLRLLDKLMQEDSKNASI